LDSDADGVAITGNADMGTFIAKVSTAAILALAALPAFGLAQAAHAAPAAPVVRIPIGDLDLGKAEHARIFKARIDAAGETMCQARTRQDRLGAWSAHACRLDFQQDVRALLTRPQMRALRSVGG
jgi:UrcA family protein